MSFVILAATFESGCALSMHWTRVPVRIALTGRVIAAYREKMSTTVARMRIWGVCAGLLASACTVGDEGSMGDSDGLDGSSTAAPAGTGDDGTPTPEDTGSSDGGGNDDDGSSGAPNPADSSGGGESTDDGDADSGGSESGGEPVFDDEFVWVADFLRTNCVACHATNMNGNLLLPAADITNEEVRLALEGVMATTGILLVEPYDRETSQTYLQITNEFGAQFPVEDTDRFGAWIDAGAPYYVP